MPANKRCFFILFFLSLFILFLCPINAQSKTEQVAIFLSSKIRPYIEALNGLEQVINNDFQVFDLSQNLPLAKHYAENGDFAAAIAIGPEATKLIFNHSNIPIKISIMTLDIKKLLNKQTVCGIDLRIPIEKQLRIIKSYLGPNRNIAILYNLKENQDVINRAQKASKELKLNLIPIVVNNSSEIMTKLNPILSKLDLILFIPDSVVISEKIITHITKKALLAGVAIGGYNSFFYEIGGLICFVIDYKKIGQEAARLLNLALKDNLCLLHSPQINVLWNSKVFEILKKIKPDKWDKPILKGGDK